VSRVDPSRLADLEDALNEVRSWPGVDDRGGGTFYLHRKPFLHFHAGQQGRRADVHGSDGWLEIELPEPLPDASRERFLSVLRTERAGRSPHQKPSKQG
jgi:hypothetical protein